ncbi:glycosyl hydrolase 57 family protein [Synechococcus sp. A18-25c]|uniref:glycosyl hydrolase family 57 n=1 Tax=Synechococcus sp. A18-25c TaxID=1866938 RepID=UPI0016484964|nr:glycosyl hydrolase 57 family protein [Synechococcus sp. A18-25c]
MAEQSDYLSICGREQSIQSLMQNREYFWQASESHDTRHLRSAFACALHMHQPTVPAGPHGELISHLQYMFDHSDEGDNHNAEAFAHCYRRMADLIPELIEEGCEPRIMLDYSGNLLWGLAQMGREDIIQSLRFLACNDAMQQHVEWLGSFWGHAVAPSTPIPDLSLQIRAWQHQFARLFGNDALRRVRGFSLPEMHLPNHPDTLFALLHALRDAGYRWLMVQEHSVEQRDGSTLSAHQRYVPNRLMARSSTGDEVSMIALIKTQGSDTKLVGQMQPCAEALGLERQCIGGVQVPSLVTQIADGENGGVMMNEFPDAFRQANRRIRDQGVATAALNGSEYLQALDDLQVSWDALPQIQAVHQHKLWTHLGAATKPSNLNDAIAALQKQDQSLAMEGASWTNDLSWVRGYENVLEPMQQLSATFHQVFDTRRSEQPSITTTDLYRDALLHLLLLETSCFRYWGQGLWTDFAREIHRRGESLLLAARSA